MWRHPKSFVWDRFTAYILHRTIYHYWSPLKGKLNDWIRILLCGNIEATHLCTLESPSGQILTFWKFVAVALLIFIWVFQDGHLQGAILSQRILGSCEAGVTSIDTLSKYYFLIVIHISQSKAFTEKDAQIGLICRSCKNPSLTVGTGI